MNIKQLNQKINLLNKVEDLEMPEEGVFSFKDLLEQEKISKGAYERLLSVGEELKKEEFNFLRGLKSEFGDEVDICLVGGMVRDAVLNKEAKDFDFIVSFHGSRFNTHEEARGAFENFMEKGECGKINLVGRDFGVYKLNVGGEIGEIDISFPRIEKVLDPELKGVHDNFDVKSNALLTVKDDLGRRDLDMNAMAMRVKDLNGNNEFFKFLDLYGGLDSINFKSEDGSKGRIRAVGNPEKRFEEDLSRILRAIRFAAKFNYEIEPRTWQAIEKIVGEGFLNKTYEQKVNNEKGKEILAERYFIPRETLSVELCKTFVYNPEEALRLMRLPIKVEGRESSILEEIIPDLFNETRLTKKQLKFLSPENKKIYLDKFGEDKDGKRVISEPDALEIKNTRVLKEASLDRASEMYKIAREGGVNLNQEEVFVILFHNAGQTEKLAEVIDSERTFYPMSQHLSRIYWEKSYKELKMMAFRPQDRKFMVAGNEVNHLIETIPSVFGLLNGKNGDGENTKKEYGKRTLGKIYDYFPQGIDDSLYKLIELDIEATDAITDNTRKNFKELGEFLQKNKTNLEIKYGSINENFNNILTSTDIFEVFHIKQGPLFRQLLTAAKNNFYKYLLEAYNNGEDYSETKAKEIMFNTIINRPEARAQLRGLATDSLYDDMFKNERGDKENIVNEYPGKPGEISNREKFKREVMALIENKVYKDYINRSIDNSNLPKEFINRSKSRVQEFRKIFLGLAKNNPMLLQEIIISDIKKQGKGKFLVNGEIINGPDKIKGQPKEYDSFFDIIMPAIANLYKVEQPKKYHSEGDVMRHTFLTLDSARELAQEDKFELDDELVVAILLHDSGKPDAMRYNEKTERILMAGHEKINRTDIEPVLEVLNIDKSRWNNILRAINKHMDLYMIWSGLDEAKGAKGIFDENLTRKVYELFPDGSGDLLYKLTLSDLRGTIDENGLSQYDQYKTQIDALGEQLKEIDSINKLGLDFNKFQSDSNIRFTFKDIKNKTENFGLFREFCKVAVKERYEPKTAYREYFNSLMNSSPETSRRFLANYFGLKKFAFNFIKQNKEKLELKGADKSNARNFVQEFLTDERVEEYVGGDYSKLNIKEDFENWIVKTTN